MPKKVLIERFGQEITPAKLHLIYQNNEKCKFFNAWKVSSLTVGAFDEVTFFISCEHYNSYLISMSAGTRMIDALVFEVTNTCEDHRHVVLITKVDRVLIFHGTTRLDHRFDAMLMGNLNAVGKGEKGVGSHHCSL